MDEMKVPVNPTPSELNPNIEDIKTKHPFHGFWVQKALPLVYDDSLSYYEVISRIQEYINGLSDDVKTLAANVDNLLDAYNQLVSWVDAEITRYETELNQEFDQHKQAVIQMFNTFKSELENTFEQYKDELKKQSDQHMSELEQQFEAYKNELKTQADQHKSELETQFEGYKSDIDNQISEFKDDVDQTLQEQDRKIQQNSDDITDIQAEQQTQNTSIQKNASDISDIKAEQETQNTNIQNNADAISVIQTEQQTQNTSIQKNASDIADIQAEQLTQNTNIQNNTDAISDIQAEQKTQNTNIQKNADAISTIQTEQQTQNTAIQKNANDIQIALTEIDGSLAAVESDVMDLQQQSGKLNAILLTNEDLNDYQGENYWGKAYYGMGANSVANAPLTGKAFGLLILRSGNAATSQIYYSSGSDPTLCYIRTYDEIWSSWSQAIDNLTLANTLSVRLDEKADTDGQNAIGDWPINVTGKATSAGTADSAAKLTTARTFPAVNLAGTSGASFDGSANPAALGVTGTLPVGHGGTGATTAADARTALEITPANIGAVPTSRKVNSKALTADISLSASDVGAVAKTGDTMTGDLTLSGESRAIKFASGTRTGAPITFYAGNADGSGIVIGDGGRTIVGAGEAARNLRTEIGTTVTDEASENLHLGSDGNIYLYTNCNTIANRKTITINTSGNINAPGGFTGSLSGKATSAGTADSAAKLTTARTFPAVNLAGTSGASFDGSANPAALGVTGTLPVGHGGTGATTAAAARTALEITPANIGAVPTSRKVNSKALTADISLSASDVGAVAKTGDTMTGDLTLSGESRAIKFASGTRTGAPITFYAGNANGSGIVIGDGGRTIVGAGEAARNLRTEIGATVTDEASENLHLGADGNIYLYTNCNTIANRKTITINTSGNINAPGGFTGSLSGKATSAGTADSAAKLTTARTFPAVNLAGTSGASFDGSANPAALGVTGTLPVGHGGTGATTAADARTNLGVPSTTGTGATGTWPISITGKAEILGTPDATTSQGKWYKIAGGNYALVLWNHPTPGVTDEWYKLLSWENTSVWSFEEAITVPTAFNVNVSRVSQDSITTINSKWYYPINITVEATGKYLYIRFYTNINPNDVGDFYIYYSGFSILPLTQVA